MDRERECIKRLDVRQSASCICGAFRKSVRSYILRVPGSPPKVELSKLKVALVGRPKPAILFQGLESVVYENNPKGPAILQEGSLRLSLARAQLRAALKNIFLERIVWPDEGQYFILTA